MIRSGRSAALLVSKGVLDDVGEREPAPSALLSRREALRTVLRGFSADDVVYAGIGDTRPNNFLPCVRPPVNQQQPMAATS